MPTTDHLFAQEAIERIGQLEETFLLRQSPVHLAQCGGCGAPAYQQPCAICNFYPFGSDKGTYSPVVATFEHFKKAIDRSGVNGAEGTLATWYFKTRFSNNTILRLMQTDAVEAASKLDAMPSARVIWNIVAVDGQAIHRPQPERHIREGWRGMEELNQLRGNRDMDSKLSVKIASAVDSWVKATHEKDEVSIREALQEGVETLRRCSHLKSGNARLASQFLLEAMEHQPQSTMAL